MKLFINIMVLATALFGCKPDERVPAEARNLVQLSINRLEQDLWKLNLDRIPEEIPAIQKSYGRFAELYFEELIRVGSLNNPAFSEYLTTFLTDYTVNTAYSEALKIYPDVRTITKELSSAFSLYYYYFPDKVVPAVYTFVSGFNQSIVTDSAILAIGLDKYLGADHQVYKMLGWERYLVARMDPAYMVPDAVYAWLITEFAYNDSADNLINQMLYHGKAYALTKMLLPQTPDSLVFGFTAPQMDWCVNNEKQMWTYFVENKLLFDATPETIRKFVATAPYTKDFTDESPGQAALWLGARIVESYRQNNRHVSPAQWMAITDYRSILANSGYRP